MLDNVNALAILLAAISSMVVGSIWYSQNVFGSKWAKLAKVKMDKKPVPGEMARLLGSTFIASLFTAFVVAHVSYFSHVALNNTFLTDSLSAAFWLWFGLTASRLYVHDAFEGRAKELTALNIAHEFVTIMLMALIIGAMGI